MRCGNSRIVADANGASLPRCVAATVAVRHGHDAFNSPYAHGAVCFRAP